MTRKINHRQFFLFLILVIVLAACNVGKKYQRPALELPPQFNNVSFADTSSIADVKWKDFLKDATLQGLVDSGIRYNRDLLLAMNRMEVAQKELRQSKLLWFPQLDFQATGQYNRPSKNSLNGKSVNSFLGKSYLENYQAMVSLSWEVDIWGKIGRQKDAALAQYLQSYEGAKAVQTQLVASIAQGYYNLLMLDRQLEITRQNLALSDSFVVATQLLNDAGEGNSLAVQQAESQRQSTALLIPQLEQSIAIQENALQQLTGHLPGSLVRKSSLNDITVPDHLSTGLPAAVVSRRPDVRETEMGLVAANARVGIARANMYPALNITAGGGVESYQFSNWFNIPNSLFGLAAGAIAQPVFKRKALRTQFEIAKLQREQSVITFRQSVLTALREVEDALVSIDKLNQQHIIAQNQVDTLKQAVSNSQLLFKSDMATYLEVLTVQESALKAELNLALIRRLQLSAIVDLYRSLGGGWQ